MDVFTLVTIVGVVACTAVVMYLIITNGARGKSYEEALADQRRAQIENKEKPPAAKKPWRPKKFRHDRKKKDKTLQSATDSSDEAKHDELVVNKIEEPVEADGRSSSLQVVEESAEEPVTTPTPPMTPAPHSVTTSVAATVTTTTTTGPTGQHSTHTGHGKKKSGGTAVVNGVVGKEAVLKESSLQRRRAGQQEATAGGGPKGPAGDAAQPEGTSGVSKGPAGDAVQPEGTSGVSKGPAGDAPVQQVNGVHPTPPLKNGHQTLEAAVEAEDAVLVNTANINNNNNATKKRRPSDRKRAAGTGGGQHGVNDLSLKRLRGMVEAAALSQLEIQTLIDLLLNKQSSSEWISSRPDPITLMKKQLDEVQQRLGDAQRTATSSEDRLQQLRQELNQERSRAGLQRRQLDERLQQAEQRRVNEAAAAAKQLQQLQEAGQLQLLQGRATATAEHQHQLTRIQGELEQMRGERDSLSAAGEERDRLRGELQLSRDELERLKLAAGEERDLLRRQLAETVAGRQLVDTTRAALQTELQQLQSIHGGLERENNALKQQMTSMQEEMTDGQRALQQRLAEADRQLKTARGQQLQQQAETARLLNELQETRLELEQAREEAATASHRQNGLDSSAAGQNEQQQKQLKAQIQQLSDQLQQSRQLQPAAVQEALLGERQLLKRALLDSFPKLPVQQLNMDAAGWPTELCRRLQQQLVTAQQPEEPPRQLEDAGAAAVLEQLHDKNSQLEQQVQHYQAVLTDTESILTRLQTSVEKEDSSWRRQLADKQLEVDQLREALNTGS